MLKVFGHHIVSGVEDSYLMIPAVTALVLAGLAWAWVAAKQKS